MRAARRIGSCLVSLEARAEAVKSAAAMAELAEAVKSAAAMQARAEHAEKLLE